MKRCDPVDLLFLFCSGLFLLHQLGERIVGINMPFIDSYLDPILLMPILLHLITWERRIVFGNKSYQLSGYHMFGYFVLIAIVAELVLPQLTPKLISDRYDVACYALGALIYFSALYDVGRF